MKNIWIITFFILFFAYQGPSQEFVKAKANKTLVSLVKSKMKPLNSQSDNFSDLQFLKEELSDKKIVYLGESNHHSESYNEIKFRLIRFLHQELDFNVVAFESNLSSCMHCNLVKDSIDAFYILTHSILGAWRTPINAELMNYIKQNNLNITGFDPNLNSLILDKEYYIQLLPNHQEVVEKLFILDSTISQYNRDRFKYFSGKEIDKILQERLDSVRESLITPYIDILATINSLDKQIESHMSHVFQLSIKNKLYLLESSNDISQSFDKRMITNEQREQLMAQNIQYLIDSIYFDKKIVIWAHNDHISKGGGSTVVGSKTATVNNSIGHRLYKIYGTESYYIGLYGFPGNIGKGYIKDTYLLNSAKKNSLEAILYNSGADMFFLKTDLELFEDPMWNFTELNYKKRSIISDCYDAIIFTRDLKPAVLIRINEKEIYEKKYSVQHRACGQLVQKRFCPPWRTIKYKT